MPGPFRLRHEIVLTVCAMRILFVVPSVPSRLTPRPSDFIRQLSGRHDVSVLCVTRNESQCRSAAEVVRHCRRAEVFRISLLQSLWNCLRALFSSRALRTAFFYSPGLQRRVEEEVARGKIDLIHAEHLKTIPMIMSVRGHVPIVFDAVDCISMMEMRRRKVLRNPLLRLFSWAEEMKMRRWETWASKYIGGIVISSMVDKESYPSHPSSRHRIKVVPNCVDLEYFSFQGFKPRRDTIIFCANLAYFPNEDAALYLLRSIWPTLRARQPNLRLEIVGSRPSRRVKELNGKENVRVVGSVPDVRPHLGRAWIALCPVRVQAGTQNKILQAMALGVPVVATRDCCAGLAVESGRDLLTADSPEEFVSAIELLLGNDDLRNALVRNARSYVEMNHSCDGSVEKLLAAYAEVLSDFGTKNSSVTIDVEG